jgi:8-oxo-dGTP pyrophosphatase MutT (NUDIX family)
VSLDLAPGGGGATPRDAATLVLLKPSGSSFEVLFVERHQKSAFMGGAVVFPGGKVDDSDRDPAWSLHSTLPRAAPFASDPDEARAFGVAACREALEEAAIVPLAASTQSHDALVLLRARVTRKETTLLAYLAEHEKMLDLGALYPLARWVTPVEESRRFDARFFLCVAPEGQRGVHDGRETTASFWARPEDVLEQFGQGRLWLAPPTHRTLEVLASAKTVEEALAGAARASKEPICPRLVRHADGDIETLALTLPGDPEHPVAEPRVAGASRFVLTGERWLPGSPPAAARPAQGALNDPADTPGRR